MTPQSAATDAATLTLELPAEVRLDSLNDDRFRVKEPIPVRIFKDGEGFILAEAVGFKEFGEGDSPAAALDDLRYALVDLYFSLEGEQHRLGQWLQSVWQDLQTRVERQGRVL